MIKSEWNILTNMHGKTQPYELFHQTYEFIKLETSRFPSTLAFLLCGCFSVGTFDTSHFILI